MNHGYTIRIVPLQLDDENHSTALLTLLDEYARDPMGGGHPLQDETRNTLVSRLASRGDYVGFLAFLGDQAVGLINCFEGFSTFAARPLLNVHDIAVSAGHRGKGIGTALLEQAEAEGCQRGCCKMTLEVLSNNHGALKAYARAGFAPYQLDPAAGQAVFMQKWL